MTLKQLIETYKGKIAFDIYQAVSGGEDEVITFSSEDIDAIKDTILAKTVQEYEVVVENNVKAIASIRVVLSA